MLMWQKLIFSYCKSLSTYSMTFTEFYESPIAQNTTINRRLNQESIKQICKWMVDNKYAEFTSKAVVADNGETIE